jgi:hypothetical protein
MKAGKISYTGVGVAAGGAIGFLGVAIGWFSYSVPFAGGTATVSLSGTADWTGTAALIGAIGAFAFGGAFLVLNDTKLRRTLSVLMAASAAFLLVMSVFGSTRASDAVGVPAALFSSSLDKGLAVSFAGGILAFVAALLATRETGAQETESTSASAPAEAVEA